MLLSCTSVVSACAGISRSLDHRTAPSVTGGGTELGGFADGGLNGIGIVRGNEGANEASEIEYQTHLLPRSSRIEVGPIARVRGAPYPCPASEGTNVDSSDRTYRTEGDALGTPWEVVPADLNA